jgi:ketosteroid isomerase-like protein
MLQENVEAAKRFIGAYNRQDFEAMLDDLDPEIELQSGILTKLGGEAAVYREHEGFARACETCFGALGETRSEYSEIRGLGDRTVTIGCLRARGRESGAETESPWGGVADFKNGKAICIRSYVNVEEALEAAGCRSS